MTIPPGQDGESQRDRLTVLVTRPRPQAVATARLLHQAGHRALLDPLLTVQSVPFTVPGDAALAAIILTSANAAFALGSALAALPVFAVGEATAAAARRRGAGRIHVARGDAEQLAMLIRRSLAPGDGPVLHLSGEEVKPGLADALEDEGYDYRRVVVYRAVPSGNLAARTLRSLHEQSLDAVLLFSPRTAAVFRDLVTAGRLDGNLGITSAVCLSQDVAERVVSLPWRQVLVAERRSQEALLARLESLTGTC